MRCFIELSIIIFLSFILYHLRLRELSSLVLWGILFIGYKLDFEKKEVV